MKNLTLKVPYDGAERRCRLSECLEVEGEGKEGEETIL